MAARWPLVVGAVVVALVTGVWMWTGRDDRLAHMSASDARVSLAEDGGTPLTIIDRNESPEVYFRVVLHDPPLAGRLRLHCDWVDPEGRVSRRNNYQTRVVYKRTWPTYCRQRFGPEAP